MFLENKYKGSVEVLVGGEKTTVNYADLSMALDINKTMEGLKISSISDLIDKWLFSPSRKTLLQPVFIFGDDFEKLAIEKLPKKELSDEKIVFNPETGLFDYSVGERKSNIDAVDLQVKLISFSDAKPGPISAENIVESSDLERKLNIFNNNLKELYSKPVDILVEKQNQKISINPKDIINFDVKSDFSAAKLVVDKEKIKKILAENGVTTSVGWTTKNIQDNLTARYKNGEAKPVVLGADIGPNTNGEIANRYIEVDLSQQKMYFFDKGELFKTYIVSTGLNYPTPVGSYKIKNKLPMGYSGIFNVWMPWWMAFEYRNDIGAYLGIHELPYKLVGGQKIYRFGNYIGSRKTGGCIALAPGDSKEVYDNSFPGMDVLVYQ